MIQKPKHLAFILKVDLVEINSIINNIDKYYKEIIFPKSDKYGNIRTDKNGNPKTRTINPSINRLKVIQKRILSNILLELKMPDYAYGAVKGRDNIDNANKHKGKKYKFTTDLKDFFPSISHKAVYNMYLENKFSHQVSSILTKLTTYKGRIPQGAPTSSSIANLVFSKTGNILENFAKNNDITFTSFVDDLSFSSSYDFKDKVPEIIKIITNCYRISHHKTNYSRNPNITGLHPMNNHLKLPNSFMNKINSTDKKSKEQIAGLLRYKARVQKKNYCKK